MIVMEVQHNLNRHHHTKDVQFNLISHPCCFRKVDCDSEVFFLRLWLVGAGLTRCSHRNALLLCFLLIFLYFLLKNK